MKRCGSLGTTLLLRHPDANLEHAPISKLPMSERAGWQAGALMFCQTFRLHAMH